MPPEYIIEGTVSLKNDVYGFGVTLLETISGMSESGRGARHQASIEWVSTYLLRFVLLLLNSYIILT